MKKIKEISVKNVFCIRENGKWVAGIYNAGRTIKPIGDKNQAFALALLANELFKLLS